jgi:hypothetical protein
MKRISSRITFFHRKILPIILGIGFLILVIGYLTSSIKLELSIAMFFALLIFLYGWLSKFRKLKDVFLGKDFIIVNGNKINFEKIISIKRVNLGAHFNVEYFENNDIKTFIYLPNFIISVLFLPPSYIKRIAEYNKRK